MTSEKVRENRARRAAERQGLTLVKSRARDPRARSFGKYQLVNEGGRTVFGWFDRPAGGADLDAIEEYLAMKVPFWATAHDETEGGICWTRETEVEIEPMFTTPGAEPLKVQVKAVAADNLKVQDDGSVIVVRDEVDIHVAGERMTLEQARALAEAILSVVDAVENAGREQ